SPSLGTNNNLLNAVGVVSANDVWAVGNYFSGTLHSLVEHWDGTAWSVDSSGSVQGVELRGVGVVSANDVWAVGDYAGSTLTMHWDGTAWSVVPSPNPGTILNGLKAVAVVSANDVWAVGDYFTADYETTKTLVEHWDGTAWSIVSSPSPSATTSTLNGVAAVSANDVWAVGCYNG